MLTMKQENSLKVLIDLKERMLKEDGYISFTTAELNKFDKKTAEKMISHFHGRAMIALPEDEIMFFEWLKKNDRPVWNDLWEGEDAFYRISIDFLHHFLKYGNGFPICDLINEDNYWFCIRHIKPKGIELMEQIGKKVNNNQSLTFAEAFLLEVFRGSIDLWHFCYRNKIPLKTGKSRIDDMHLDDLLVHLPAREDLVKYLDI